MLKGGLDKEKSEEKINKFDFKLLDNMYLAFQKGATF